MNLYSNANIGGQDNFCHPGRIVSWRQCNLVTQWFGRSVNTAQILIRHTAESGAHDPSLGDASNEKDILWQKRRVRLESYIWLDSANLSKARYRNVRECHGDAVVLPLRTSRPHVDGNSTRAGTLAVKRAPGNRKAVRISLKKVCCAAIKWSASLRIPSARSEGAGAADNIAVWAIREWYGESSAPCKVIVVDRDEASRPWNFCEDG